MSITGKIVFLEDLWGSLALNAQAIPIPESHVQELDRHLARHAGNPGSLLSLPELQHKIASRT